MTVKHKLIAMGVDYAKNEQSKKAVAKATEKRKAKIAKAKAHKKETEE